MDTRETSRQREAQQQVLPALYASYSAVFGFLAVTALRGYLIWIVIPVAVGAGAYAMLGDVWRRRFLILAGVNVLVGAVAHFLPHASNGGLGGLGILLVMGCAVGDLVQFRKLFREESARRLAANTGAVGGASDSVGSGQ